MGFKEIKADIRDLDLHEVPVSEITRDISIYLKKKFLEIRRAHDISQDWPGDEAIQVLLAKTVPLFISAVTLCRFINDANWVPQDRLKEIINDQSKYVSKMASTYLPVLKQLLIGQNKQETQQLVKEFRQIVGAIIVLATPLSVSALSNLLDLEPNKIQIRIDRLHSVLNIPAESRLSDRPVRLLHQSFRDFLLDNETKEMEGGKQFWVHKKMVHQNLTYQCLDVMRRKLRKNICDLPDDCLQRNDISSDSVKRHLPPELRYACRYWAQHLVQSQEQARMLAMALSTLKVHLLHWVEAMSILGILSEVLEIIKRVQSAIQVSIHEGQAYL
jgi:hypothetical protein